VSCASSEGLVFGKSLGQVTSRMPCSGFWIGKTGGPGRKGDGFPEEVALGIRGGLVITVITFTSTPCGQPAEF